MSEKKKTTAPKSAEEKEQKNRIPEHISGAEKLNELIERGKKNGKLNMNGSSKSSLKSTSRATVTSGSTNWPRTVRTKDILRLNRYSTNIWRKTNGGNH